MTSELKSYIEYHPNGNVWLKGQHKSNGQREGLWEWFSINGNIKWRGTYKENKMDGIQEWFYKDGNILSRTPCKDDKIDGTQNFYDEQGNITVTRVWKDGKLIKETQH
jgi:antitoxin component YwqK of YwqJK toxin-antitoxin module